MYDLIIIGAGPAGMTAAIYGARREMKTLIIGKELGGQVSLASEIENYPGFKNIASFDLITKIKEQTLDLGVELIEQEVKEVSKVNDGHFKLKTEHGEFEGKTVIIAMGLSPRRLAVPGEVELAGRGVSYCANCDGPFFKKKIVAIIGGGNSALDAAEVMSKIAEKVYLVHRRHNFTAFETLVEEVRGRENIEVVSNFSMKSIEGKEKVEKIIITETDTKEEKEIKLDGVFIEIGRIASTDLVEEFVDRNEQKQIIVNQLAETKTPGLFAAGDVTNIEFKQITIAMGQATVAALSAYQYIQMNKK